VLEPRARAAIDGHVRLLLAWNAAINLTAITDPVEIAARHVVDSLAAIPLVRDVPTLVDLGSGGGFPGVPLAAAIGGSAVTLVDSIGKKAAFLRAVATATGLAGRLRVEARRAESLAGDPAHRARSAVVTARAVGPLADLIELAMPLLEPGGRLIAWKRGEATSGVAAEMASARAAAAGLGAGPIVVHDVRVARLPGHRLIEVRKLRATPVGYPRDPAARRRNPW
jgi:16S rRNA (guanine527-N7)-methyltransferase